MDKENEEVLLERRDAPSLALRGVMIPESLNEEARTIRVQYTTGAKVLRRRFWEDDFYEELSTEKGHVRLGRMKDGAAPVLNSHRNYDLRDVMGTIIEADETHCTMKFSERSDVEEYWKDIRAGIIRNVSVGYFVHRYLDVTPDGDKIRVLRAIDWEPFEVSMVAVGADAGAGVRSQETNLCVVIGNHARNEKGQINMDKDNPAQVPGNNPEQRTNNPAPATLSQADVDAAARAAADAEFTRQTEIRTLVRGQGLEESVAEDLITKRTAIEEARKIVLDKLAARSEEAPIRSNVRITQDEKETRMAALENALMHRYAPGIHALSEPGREFRGMSLLEIAREFVGKEARGLNKLELAGRALHSTSDFSTTLANVANKTLRQGYADTKRSFQPFCRQVTLPDFKSVQRSALSNGPSLKLVVEGGEYEYGTFTEGAETYRLFTYGRIVGITREAIINDDLDAFTRIPQKMAAASARLENRMVYDILLQNPAMADGTALFHADHDNLTNALLGIDGWATIRKLVRLQTDTSGEDALNLEAKYLIVPASQEVKALQLQAQITANDSTKVNPYSNRFEIITEAYLDTVDAVSYYGAIDPSQGDTIEYAYLEGETGPYVESREGFNRDGLEIKVRHDFATKAIDFRGLAKSTNNA